MEELDRNTKKLLKLLGGKKSITALMAGGLVFEKGAKGRIRDQGLIETGNMRVSTTARPDVIARNPSVVIGPTVNYAAIHEFGGTVKPTVTPKMRRFAWAMFRKTKESMWKGLALTKKKQLNIRIPARPYMRPTFDEDRKTAVKAIKKTIQKLIKRKF